MATYVTLADLNARLPYSTFGASTDPNTTEIGYWLDEGEALVLGALLSGGNPGTYSDAQALLILRAWIMDYVEARTRRAYAESAVAESVDDGERILQRFYDRLDWIENNPGMAGAMLGAGSAAVATLRMRSYQTHNSDDRSVDNGDFDPLFKISDLKGNF
jgi:hypothetical protein